MASSTESIAPYRAGLGFSFFNAFTWLVVLGTPMVLLAEELGASSFVVGLCYSFVFLMTPLQVVSTALLHVLGYKRQMVLFWSLRVACIFPILWIALKAPEPGETWPIIVLVVSLFAFTFFRSMGNSAPLPWLYDLIPEKLRGRYFATDLAVIGFCGVFTMILCSASFLYLETHVAIQAQFILAIIGGLSAVGFISRLPSVPKPAPMGIGSIFSSAPKIISENKPFRSYLIISVSMNAINAAAYPYFAFYLKRNVGFDQVPILYFTAVQYFGGYMAALLVKRLIDRIRIQWVFETFLVIQIINYAFWILVLLGYKELLFFCPVMFFLIGGGFSLYHTAHNKYLPQLSDKDRRPLTVALLATSIGFVSGAFTSCLGLGLRDAEGVFLENRFLAFMIFALVAQCLLMVAYWKLPDQDRGAEPLVVFTGWLRPFRSLLSSSLPFRKRS